MRVGDLVRDERERQGLAQVELARMARVSPAAISLLEKGDRLGNADTVVKITTALGIPADRVFRCILGMEAEPSTRAPKVLDQVDDLLKRVVALESRHRRDTDPSARRLYLAAAGVR